MRKVLLMDTKRFEKLEAEIKELETKKRDGDRAAMQLRFARNQLAFFSAIAFAVVRSPLEEGGVAVYGVSPEVKRTYAHGFSFSTSRDLIQIHLSFATGALKLELPIGGGIAFTIVDQIDEEGKNGRITPCEVRVFRHVDEANSFATA